MSDSDQTSSIDYELLVEDSLRTVVRGALAIVQEYGLPGECHFYITFRTQADGVELDETIKDGNPQEMTIVLQHQFWDLTVEEKQFSVGLSFSGVQHNLVIPFSAVTHFTDPSVGFGLQFSDPDDTQKNSNNEDGDKSVILREVLPEDQKEQDIPHQKQPERQISNVLTHSTSSSFTEAEEASEDEDTETIETETAEIVSLDRFRKDPAPKS